MKSSFLLNFLCVKRLFLCLALALPVTLKAQWTSTGPYGSPINVICANSNSIFAGTAFGLFRSTNSGDNWTKLNHGSYPIIQALAVNGDYIYVGSNGGGVAISTDNGDNWTTSNDGLTSMSIISLAVNGNNLFAGTSQGGIFLSTDHGNSWTAMNNGLADMNIHCLLANGDIIFAGTSNGIFFSANNGSSWTAVNNGLTNTYVNSLAINGDNIFAATLAGVFFSTNNGANWTEINSGLTNTSVHSLITDGANTHAGTSGGVFLSEDNGMNWLAVTNGLSNTYVKSLAKNDNNVFAGTNAGVYISSNAGTNWTWVNNGLSSAIDAIGSIENNILGGTRAGLFLSIDDGQNWAWVNNGPTDFQVSSILNIGNVIFCGGQGGVYRSTDNGSNWTNTSNGLSNNAVVSMAQGGNTIFAGTTTSGIYRSLDNGDSWQAINNGFPNPSFYVYSVAAYTNTVIVATDHGIYRSANNGNDWALVSPNIVRALSILDGAMFAGGNGLFRSINDGSDWIKVNDLSGFNSFAIHGTLLFAATINEVLLSDDQGDSWTSVNKGIGANAWLTSLTANNTRLFVGSRYNSVFFRLLSEFNGVPKITGVSPSDGNPGTTVTISGVNFSTTPSENTVKFNNTVATVTFSTSTSITATVPSDATTGKISVTVDRETATSASTFTVTTSSPTITNFHPGSGSIGAAITISGMNFSTTPSNNIVKFNGATATVTASTTTSIATTVPLDATTGTISVTVSGETATSASPFTVISSAPSPSISNFSPTSGSIGAVVTISGTNFSTTPGDNTVEFNGTTATVSACTTTSITTTVPWGATTGSISVTVNGQTATSASPFTVISSVPSPSITNFSPASGSIGVVVTISGTNFSPTPSENTVKFNGTTAEVSASTTTSITTTVPPGATTGLISVAVNGQIVTSALTFTVTNSIAMWVEKNNGLYGGGVRCLASAGNVLLASMDNELVYRSTDFGNTWTKVDDLRRAKISCLAMSNDYLFAGSVEGLYGLFRSSDNGYTWTQIFTDLTTHSLAISGSNIFAGTNGGVYRSSDNGNSWASFNNGLPNTMVVESLIYTGGNIFAGGYNGLFSSADGGNNWNRLENGLPPNVFIHTLAVSASYIFAGTSGDGIYRSEDGGNSWMPVTGLNKDYVYSLAVSGAFIYACTGTDGVLGDVYRSSDNGATWTKVNSSAQTSPNSVTSLATNSGYIFAGTSSDYGVLDHGIFRLMGNGDVWEQVNTGLTSTFVYSMAATSDNLFVGTQGRLFRSDNQGNSWTKVYTFTTGSSFITVADINALAVKGDYLFAGAAGIQRSSDNGITWTKLKTAGAYCLAVSGNYIFAGSAQGILRSDDNGTTWIEVNNGLIDVDGFEIQHVYAITVSNGFLFAGTPRGVFRSSNNGDTWTYAFASNGVGAVPISSFAVSGNYLYVATGNYGIYRTADNGDTWTYIDIPFAGSHNSIAASGKEVFTDHSNIVSDDQIYLSRSTDNGETWQKFDDGFEDHMRINLLFVNGETLFAGTLGRGIWAINIPKKQTQTITFDTIPDRALGSDPFQLSATASSGLEVSFTAKNSKVSITGSTVTLLSPGRTTITASQGGDDNFYPAASVHQSFCVKPAEPSISISDENTEFITLTSSASSGNQWYKDGIVISGANSNTIQVTGNGIYKVQVTVDSCVSDFSSDVPIVITGIREFETASVSVYPNPATDKLLIRGLTNPKQASIVSTLGEASIVPLTKLKDVHQVDVRDLPDGCYFITIHDKNETYRMKFFKL